MREKNIFNQITSLKTKIIILIIIIITAFEGLSTTIVMFRERQRAYTELEKEKDKITGELMTSMVNLLWNYNYEQVKNLIIAKLKERDFLGLIIYDSEKKSPLIYMAKDSIKTTEFNDLFNNLEKLDIKISKELIYEDKPYWIADFYFTEKFILNDIIKLFLYYVISSIFLIVIISGTLYILLNSLIIKPIKTTSYTLKDISAGKGDLTQKIEINSNDELGKLSSFFNDFMTTLNNMVKNIKNITERTKNISDNLASSSSDSLEALDEIHINIENIKNKIVNLDGQIGISNKSAGDVKDYINKVVNEITEQAAAINQSSAFIEQISALINNVALISAEKLKITNELEEIAVTGSNDIKKTIEIIKKINDSIGIIMSMMKVISDITTKTNLLAMNAAIEASHAGEKGRGFNVVAGEIRKLAEETSINSKNISVSMNQILELVHESERTNDNTEKSFNSIFTRIKQVADGMIEMKNAMGELSSSSNEITDSLKLIIETTNNVKGSSFKINNEITTIKNGLDNLANISNDTSSGMIEIEKGIREIFANAGDVSKASAENAANVNKLEDLIGQFKTD